MPDMTKPALSSRRSAFSLVIVLAVLVLLSGLLAAYLTKSRMELQATVSYSNSIEATAIARGAAEEISAGLGKEAILAITSTTPALVLARIGSDSTDPRVSNLIRRSVGNASIYSAGYSAVGQNAPPQQASDLSTAIASQNGRKISETRWRAPLLLSSTNSFTSPDWVVMTRNGSKRVTDADVPDLRKIEDAANMNAAVGRYAYMLYDLGGLLDANLAGTPSTDLDARRAQKGLQAAVDLTPIFAKSGTGTPEAFLSWRQGSLNRAYGTDPIPGSPGTPGELEIGNRAKQASGNRFISRQDMLRFMKSYNGGTTFPNSLAPYFTTYSLASNAPEVTTVLGAGSVASADAVIPRYRVEDAVSDPYTIKKGASLFPRKFPLSRLRWFGQRDSSGALTSAALAAIKQHFGLKWYDNLADAGISTPEYANVGGFVYTSPDGNAAVSSIKTLSQVAALASKREPDFFEWLKEAIATNSLGTEAGLTNSLLPGYTTGHNTQELSKDFQLIQIGANIIDQSDSDDVPTLIASSATADRRGNPLVAFGVENLPYLNELLVAISHQNTNINGWLQGEVWCPHANVGSTRKDFQGNEITQFRMKAVEGRASFDCNVLLRSSGTSIASIADQARQQTTQNTQQFAGTGTLVDTISFTAAATDYREPTMLGGSSSNSYFWGTGRKLSPGPAPWEGGFSGISIGSAKVPDRIFIEGQTFAATGQLAPFFDPAIPSITYPIGKKVYDQVLISFDPNYHPSGVPAGTPLTVVMEVFANGHWIPYQSWEQLQRFIAMIDNPTDRPNATSAGSFPFNYEIADNRETDGNLSWQRPLATEPDPYPTTNTLTARFFYGWDILYVRTSMAKSDPRTRRFGTGSSSVSTPGMGIRDTASPWIGQTTPAQAGSGSLSANWDCREFVPSGIFKNVAGYTVTGAYSALSNWAILRSSGSRLSLPLADLAKNLQTGMAYYKDADLVVRPADYAYVPDASFPTITGQKRARPVILNRPFRSVAELGYAFRDTPWKSLDMIDEVGTDSSKPINPDLGLLNVFCIDDNETELGKINPLIARKEVLEAIFRGAQLNASDATLGSISNADATTIAADFVSKIDSATSTKITTADVVNILNQVDTLKPSGTGNKFKTEAEAYGRALSGVANRRSWTLMLDVIAQAGRYPLSANKLSDFLVSGERRYWVYVTIDRYSGKVLHMEYEPVYE